MFVRLLLSFLLIFNFLDNLKSQKKYFQQSLKYKINVSLDDKKHILNAFEEIEYKNNSPDTLKFIYFHLWPNAYKNNKTALAKQILENGSTRFYYSTEKEKGWIDSLNFKVNGEKVKTEQYKDNIDIIKIVLNEALLPGKSIKISTPFRVKIPLGVFSRLGHIGQQYQITQWYPKPAVYDKYGWHPMPYLNQGEFYSEFANYDVFITLPDNYVVAATGDLINGKKELAFLNNKVKYTLSLNPDSVKNDTSFPESSTNLKTLHYHQENVHDFAWFADKRYLVLKDSVTLPESKRKVITWTMFTPKMYKYWENSTEYVKDALYYYSLWNGDYAYNQMTAVDGGLSAGGGMEYPNVTVISAINSKFLLELTIMHEVGHNWFYGMLGSNERDHPWMDEGINSYNESRYIYTKYPDAKLFKNLLGNLKFLDLFDLSEYPYYKYYQLSYELTAKKNMDQPIEEKAQNYTTYNYAAIVYAKTALAFNYLKEYLGDKKMDTLMHKYFKKWKFHHPYPDDFKEMLNKEFNNVNWFFDDLINSTKKMDYKIASLRKIQDENGEKLFQIKIKNNGQINGPVPVSTVVKANNEEKSDTTIWIDSFKKYKKINLPYNDNIKKIIIDYNEKTLDINRHNNIIKTKRIFKKIEPLHFQLLSSIDNPYKTQIGFLPTIFWNKNDGLITGIAFHNLFFPQRKVEYIFHPAWAYGSKTIVGNSELDFNFYPNRIFSYVKAKLSFKKFHYLKDEFLDIPKSLNFYKFSPSFDFTFKNKNARSHFTNKVNLRTVYINEDIANYFFNSLENKNRVNFDKNEYYVNQLKYSFLNNRVINPYKLSINLEHIAKSDNFLFVKDNYLIKSSLEFAYEISLKHKKGIYLRFFNGIILSDKGIGNSRYYFRMSGNADYSYDFAYLGRNSISSPWNQQFVIKDGGFKNFTKILLASKWISTVNVIVEVPKKKFPFSVYADFGYQNFNSGLLYDFGIRFSLIKNLAEIYLPVKISSDLNQLNYFEKIRFIFNIHYLDPHHFISSIKI